MVKPITVDKEKTVGIGPFSTEELAKIMEFGIVDVYKDDIYVARMSRQDYEEYNRTFELSVEETAYELLSTQKEALLNEYSGSTIQNIIGFVLSQQLYHQ